MKATKQSWIFSYRWLRKFKAMGGEKTLAILEALQQADITGVLPPIDADLNDLEQAEVEEMAETVIDNRNSYIEACERNRENGKKGGAPRGNQNARKQPKQPKTTERLKKQPKQPDNDNDSDIDLYITKPASNKTKFHNFNERDNTEVIEKLESKMIGG